MALAGIGPTKVPFTTIVTTVGAKCGPHRAIPRQPAADVAPMALAGPLSELSKAMCSIEPSLAAQGAAVDGGLTKTGERVRLSRQPHVHRSRCPGPSARHDRNLLETMLIFDPGHSAGRLRFECDCSITLLELVRFIDDGLTVEVRRRVEIHLTTCEACRWVISSTVTLQTRRHNALS